MATQAERITALEEQVKALIEANAKAEADAHAFIAAFPALLKTAMDAAIMPLADEVTRAHARIDHAGQVFKQMRDALTPKHEPAAPRIPRDEFDAALADLRAEADERGDHRAFFDIATIRRRVETLRAQA